MPSQQLASLGAASAVRRPDRRRGEHRERDPGLPHRRPASGRSTTRWRYATIDAFLADPSEGVGVLRRSDSACSATREPNTATARSPSSRLRGWVEAVVTQNIDGLHKRAGSRAVVEVHGSIRTSSCLDCGDGRGRSTTCCALLPLPALPALRARCSSRTSSCSASCCPRRRSSARSRWRRRRGLLLVVGSSLEVYPVAGLPLETLAAGGRLAIVQPGRDAVRRPGVGDASTPARARRCARSPQDYPSAGSDAAKIASRNVRSTAAQRARTRALRGCLRTRPRSSRRPSGRPRRARARPPASAARRAAGAPSTSRRRHGDCWTADPSRARAACARAGMEVVVDDGETPRMRRVDGQAGDERVSGSTDGARRERASAPTRSDRRRSTSRARRRSRAARPEAAVVPDRVDLARAVSASTDGSATARITSFGFDV